MPGPWIPPIPADGLPEVRDAAGKWQPGCMITQRRAVTLAALLFPEEVADGGDCRAEVGREGQPCRFCAAANAQWAVRVAQVRAAMIQAMGV